MANCLETMGLEVFRKNDEDAMALIRFTAENGKVIKGYYDYPYINHTWGTVDLILHTRRTETGVETTVLETQSAGACVWEVKVILDVTPPEYEITQKRLLVSKKDDGSNVIIDVVNADVLPSFLPGDIIKLQVVAFAQFIDYYENEEEYAKNWPGKYMISAGSIIPGQFLFNHSPDVDESKKDYSTDNVVLISGIVKCFRDGTIDMDRKKKTAIFAAPLIPSSENLSLYILLNK